MDYELMNDDRKNNNSENEGKEDEEEEEDESDNESGRTLISDQKKRLDLELQKNKEHHHDQLLLEGVFAYSMAENLAKMMTGKSKTIANQQTILESLGVKGAGGRMKAGKGGK